MRKIKLVCITRKKETKTRRNRRAEKNESKIEKTTNKNKKR